MAKLLKCFSGVALLLLLAIGAYAAPVSAAPHDDQDDVVLAAEFDKILLKALDGDAQSQYIVGYRYYYGRGVDIDVQKSISFLTRAAKQDHQAAVELLKQALLYDEGKGVLGKMLLDEEKEVADSIISMSKALINDTHVSAEVMPCFPGGLEELVKFLSTNIEYPQVARDRGIEGRVLLQLIVDKTGQVCDVRVVKSVDENIDQEAVRVSKMLPKFVPGMVNGHPVNVWYMLPIVFKLTD